MNTSTKTTRRKRFLVTAALGLAVAAFSAPGALADGRSPDTLDAVSAAQSSNLDGRSPDTLDAATANVQLDGWLNGRSPDTIDAAFAARSSVVDGRSPDTLDSISSNAVSVGDGRSADTIDATYLAHEAVVVVTASSFDWSDAGIGFGSAFGLALLALGTAYGLRRRDKAQFRLRHVST